MAKTKRAAEAETEDPAADVDDPIADVGAADDVDSADDPDPDDALDLDDDLDLPDDEEDDDEVVRLKPKATPRTRRTWRQYAQIGLVAAVFAAAFGLAGFLGWKLYEHHAVAHAGEEARQTAVDYAQVLTSIDSNAVDANFTAVLNGATGEFKDTYAEASVDLRQFLLDYRSTAQGVVTGSAIQSASEDEVVVLLMVNQSVTNTERPDPRIDRLRMKMTMQNVDGRWLASDVQLP